jgi:hypothetical protein
MFWQVVNHGSFVPSIACHPSCASFQPTAATQE